ncbi:phage capsid protein [Ancylobacter sp. WKF20]|uniref:phage capsid protein n=1 Tax=Ancylobacter sp. WKF20 TaxID=3039801 RepID=UPI0024344A6D|nr:phage capsid protein [Ancylobacter sp. WKF20]WGD31657.1 phage capsid protein [Ancylobacter sp. WKF20]
MADATVSRLGMSNATGADDALFLKKWSGEVATLFDEKNVFLPLTRVRTVSGTNSAQFPIIGNAAAYYHTPGQDLQGQLIKHAQRTITIDRLLVSPVYIPKIDEAKNHYDVRSIYAAKCAASLAIKADKTIAQLLVNAARSANAITDAAGGTVLKKTTFATSSDDLLQGIWDIARIFDEKDVDEDGRHIAVRPLQYYGLAQNTKVLNKDWGGAGAYAEGNVIKVANVTIVKSNHLPITNVTDGEQAAYNGDFTNTVAVGFTADAVGTVKLLDLASEGEWKIEKQATLMVSKYAMGHGVLRAEAAVELSKAAS